MVLQQGMMVQRMLALVGHFEGRTPVIGDDESDPVLLTLDALSRATSERPMAGRAIDRVQLDDLIDRVGALRCLPDTGIPGVGPVFMLCDPAVADAEARMHDIAGHIAAHPDIHDAGALPFFPIAVAEGLPHGVSALSPEGLRLVADMTPRLLAGRYLMGSRNHRGERQCFIDRQPANALLLPAVARALPDAVVISVMPAGGSTFDVQRQLSAVPEHLRPSHIRWPETAPSDQTAELTHDVYRALGLQHV